MTATTGCTIWSNDASDSATPLDYVPAGGPETGIAFDVPDDWVALEPESDDLRERGGTIYIDPRGADVPALYEAHLIASCGDLPVQTTAQLEFAVTQMRADAIGPVIDVIQPSDIDLVRSEYELETSTGDTEHWYAYNLLTEPGRMCSITVVTPLGESDRGWLTKVFEHIGGTIESAGG